MPNWLLIIKREQFSILKTFPKDFATGISQRSLKTVLKTDSGHAALLTDNFFFKSYPERFVSSLKKTSVLNPVKKFETVMVIFTRGRKCVFLKKKILYISFPDNSYYIEFASKALQNYKLLSYLCMSFYSILFEYLKNLKSFCGKKDAFDDFKFFKFEFNLHLFAI